ncbi:MULTISPECIES: peptidylprolyl isomerase [unclassified Paenibacillus]|uniref:peptidylprolyl isomerase n=1 Tax=unclassified Paenibacillus TaxID=185978 RepID=UPI0010491516|nr:MULTISPECIES: peptidylprolyl isomerase [unclassified Paenibacillus]NIK72344.1 peptidyl-prolyl cis-trans isomerase B (cyclophilin B) [Paenibacillus sp. BK720]TCM89562.1 peptidyl-prolyl cis-trans isomerase B (cyclophilin B) [Paenibacillus sp. BK033]
MFKRNMRLPVLALLTAALLLVIAGCGGGSKTSSNDNGTSGSGTANATATPEATDPPQPDKLLGSDKHPVVTVEMDNGKTFKVELYPEIAPNTVNNFVSLVKKGFYDGTIFHRVIPGFMIQGGDPEGSGMGGPGYSIKGEFMSNGFQNDLLHTRGVISMARSGDPDSAGSQFFVMVADAPSLDGDYAAFGKVVEGMDTVDEIVNQETEKTGEGSRPVKPMAIKKATVDTKGMTFAEPEKVNK